MERLRAIKTMMKKNWMLAAAGAAIALAVVFFGPAAGRRAGVPAPSGAPAAAQAARPDAAELLRRAEQRYDAGRRAFESGLVFSVRRLCGEAVELYRQYLEIIPGDLRAMSNMAAAALYAGQVDTAREAYRQALEEGAEWLAGAHVGYAVLLHDYDRDYRGAAEHLLQAVKLGAGGDVEKKAREMLGKIEIGE